MKQVEFKMPLRMLAALCFLLLSASAIAQQITVNGHVKDATGEPIIGATVLVQGTSNGAATDIDGNFSLSCNHGDKLQVSYVGYTTQVVTASSNVVVTLQEDSKVLNDVVVIGYGRAKKNDLTGSVTAIKTDDMNHGLQTNAQDMISGKIAGVSVISNDGTPGGGAQIRIRGGSSLNASNDPLIVIDGLAMDNYGVQGLSNPLSMVNPNDIESFTVLKDASATAIYGSRASNGVIIITTKKGRSGQKPKISYNGNVSISTKKKTIPSMNGAEYREFVKNLYGEDSEAYKALGWYPMTQSTDQYYYNNGDPVEVPGVEAKYDKDGNFQTYKGHYNIGDLRFLSRAALLGCDDNHTVRCTRTVDGGSRSILQHGEALDIVRVNHRQRVGKSLHTIVVHSQTVNNDQRVIGCVKRRTTTDTNLCATTRSTVVRDNANTGYLTADHVLSVGLQTVVHVVGLDSRDRTGEVVLFCTAITDYDNVGEHFRIFLKSHHYV